MLRLDSTRSTALIDNIENLLSVDVQVIYDYISV